MSTDPKPINQLKRTLSLRDLVLFNLVTVISLTSVATAARAGVYGLTLIIIAVLVFFIPQGIAVSKLSAAFPEEGGIYIWTKKLLGEGHGFLCGWCYWVNNILFYPTSVLGTSVIATYAINKNNTDLGQTIEYVLPFTLSALWLAALLNIIGLKRGKWLQNIGGIANYIPVIVLLFTGSYIFIHYPSANSFHVSQWIPGFDSLTEINLWATIPFAYAGLELCATLGSEIKEPARNLPRSIFIAAPFIVLFYIIGTGSMLYIIPKGNIDVIGGVFQAISIGINKIDSRLNWIVLFVAACAVVGRIGGLGAWITGSARVAFVIGIDKYFPPSFALIHPRWHTPYMAIITQTSLSTIFLLFAVLGKGTTVETVFFVLLDMTIILTFIPYVYLFIIFIVHSYNTQKGKKLTPEIIKIGSAVTGLSGLLITLFAIVVAIIPPARTDVFIFEIKTIGGSLLLVLLGGIFYWRGAKKL